MKILKQKAISFNLKMKHLPVLYVDPLTFVFTYQERFFNLSTSSFNIQQTFGSLLLPRN